MRNIAVSNNTSPPNDKIYFAFERDEKSTTLKPSKVATKVLNGNSAFLDKRLAISTPKTLVSEPKNKKLSLKERTTRLFWSWLGCNSVYNLVDAGLARFLALETLNHGTNFPSYVKINFRGADPQMGGASTGSSAGSGAPHFIEDSKNYFYVFKDTESSASFSTPLGQLNIFNKILPKMHAILAGGAGQKTLPGRVIGRICGFFTPTIKFRFTPDEVASGRFENDPDYGGLAYRTPRAISAKHIGITGSITQGINCGMFSRMKANPRKVLGGIALLAAATFAFKKTYSYLYSSWGNPTPADEKPDAPKKAPSRLQLFITRHKVKLACAAIFLNVF